MSRYASIDGESLYELASGNGQGLSSAGLMRVADVAAEPITWLWPARVPFGKLTVIDGDPGLGKSTLTLDLAARISNGGPLPDSDVPSRCGAVVLCTAEDGVADTIRPRLEAASANLEGIFVFDCVEEADGTKRPPEIPGDVAILENHVKEQGAILVVIDPLMAFLADHVRSNNDQSVRRALRSLKDLAEETGAAIVVVRHLNKSGDRNATYRGGGSIGIIGAARAGLLAAADPDDEERRILAVVKSNLGPIPPSLAYRLVSDRHRDCARIAWEGPTRHSAGDLLAAADDEETSAREEAAAFLGEVLAHDRVAAREVQHAARSAGISETTLKRAKKALGVRSRRTGFGRDSVVYWELLAPPHTGPRIAIEDHPGRVDPYVEADPLYAGRGEGPDDGGPNALLPPQDHDKRDPDGPGALGRDPKRFTR